MLLVAALFFSLIVVAAERGDRDALPADDRGAWAQAVIVDFSSVAANQTRKSFDVVTNPEEDLPQGEVWAIVVLSTRSVALSDVEDVDGDRTGPRIG